MYECMYECMCVCVYVCMNVCLYECMNVCMYVLAEVHVHGYVNLLVKHKYIYIY